VDPDKHFKTSPFTVNIAKMSRLSVETPADRKPRSTPIVEALIYGIGNSVPSGYPVELTCLPSEQIQQTVNGGCLNRL